MRLNVSLDQIARAALDDDAAVVDDADVVAQAFRFFHEMGGEQQGLALPYQAAQALPDQVAGLRVEAGGGFVEDHQVGVVDQGAGQGEAPFHAAGKGGDGDVGFAGQPGKIQQAGNALRHVALGNAEIATVDLQVLAHREIRVEIVRLRHYTDPCARLASLLRQDMAEQFHHAGIGADQAEGEAQGGGLAGAVGAEQAMAAAGSQFQVEAIHHGGIAVAFAQAGQFQGRHRLSAWFCNSRSLP